MTAHCDTEKSSGRRPGGHARAWPWCGFTARLFGFGASLLPVAVSLCAQSEPATFADLSFEQLSQIRIVIASRHLESVANTPAAVSVLQGEDVLRSGATSIPEALRWVPGMDVAQINSSDWAISARGFNGFNANKLLVMMDGRSIYTPLLAGVFWDTVDPMLEDLSRVEVVRGPGGSLWGANAVNGVVNILSKPANETLGGMIYGGGGSEKLAMGGMRYGLALSDHAWVRVYATYHLDGDSVQTDGESGHDEWDQFQTGFRLDWEPSAENHFTLQGDFYTGNRDHITPYVTPDGPQTSDAPTEVLGGNVLGRWTHELSAGSKLTVQTYYDYSRRDTVIFDESRNTFDVDAQHEWQLGTRHTITWGAGYRWSGDQTEPGLAGGFAPADYDFQLFNVFAQDQIALIQDRLKLTLGCKFEHNSFTGWEVQPGGRLLWTPTEQLTFWGGVSRAVRTPNRADTGLNYDAFYVPPGPSPDNPSPYPLILRATGNPDVKSESMIAYEAGWRMQARDNLSFDLALFYNDYKDLIIAVPDPAATFLEPDPAPLHLVTPMVFQNAADARSYGGEIALSWRPIDNLRLSPFYSYLHVDAEATMPGTVRLSSFEGSAPANQFGFRASLDLTRRWKLDLNLRWIDEVPAYDIPSYVELDARVAWKILDRLELAVTGQNLLHDRHEEFGPPVPGPAYQLQRGVYAKLTWAF